MSTRITETEMASALLARSQDRNQNAAVAAPARANEIGSPCSEWCSIEHVTRDRTIHAHISDPLSAGKLPGETQVKLVQDGGDRYRHGRPMVDLSSSGAVLQLDSSQAQELASLLTELADGSTPCQLRALADEVRAAAAVIDPARQLTATVAKVRQPEPERKDAFRRTRPELPHPHPASQQKETAL